MNKLIGIAGQIGHGKDTVAQMINDLVTEKYRVVRFAGKLKQIVALYLGVSVEQLEDRTFKHTKLGAEWTRWFVKVKYSDFGSITKDKVFSSFEDAEIYAKELKAQNFELFNEPVGYEVFSERLTPRLFLQLLGTQGMRDVVHPDVHVNGLFSDYKKVSYTNKGQPDFDWAHTKEPDPEYPNWIIPDTRFPNEAERIKKEGGIVIKVHNPTIITDSVHESETALKNWNFDHTIINDGSLDDLKIKVQNFLNAK